MLAAAVADDDYDFDPRAAFLWIPLSSPHPDLLSLPHPRLHLPFLLPPVEEEVGQTLMRKPENDKVSANDRFAGRG